MLRSRGSTCFLRERRPAIILTVFSVTATGTERVLYAFSGGADGSQPDAPLIDVKNTLYGTTPYCGNAWGAVFAVSP